MKPHEAIKQFDNAQDLVRLDRATVKEIVEDMSATRTKGSITFHFDDAGEILLEIDLRLKGEAVKRMFTERKIL